MRRSLCFTLVAALGATIALAGCGSDTASTGSPGSSAATESSVEVTPSSATPAAETTPVESTPVDTVAGESSAAGAGTVEASGGVSSTPGPAGQTSAPEQGGWSFTDDTGATITLDEVPDSIVADEGAAAALIEAGVKLKGIYAGSTVADSLALEGVDLTGIEIVGEVAGEVDVEKVLALEPDIIVSGYYLGWGSEEGYFGSLYGADDLLAQLQKIAPFVGIDHVSSASNMLERYNELAVSLGADPSTAPVATNKAAYEAAVQDLKAAVAENPGIEVAAYYLSTDYVGVGDPAGTPEFKDLAEWGVTFTPITNTSAGWAELTWETIDTYQPDLVLSDFRTGFADADAALAEFPSLKVVKAFAAKQFATWYIDLYNSYEHYTDQLTEFTAALRSAKKVS